MDKAGYAKLESALIRHYMARCPPVSQDDVLHVASLMLAEDSRARKAAVRPMGSAAFVAAQVCYIPIWTWAVQVLIVALMVALARASSSMVDAKLAVGILSASSVLVGVPTVQASKRHGMAELEYSCRNNIASILLARLIILGCSSSLVVAAMVAVTARALELSAFTVALWACPPFFCTCAGSLAMLRKAPPSSASALCAVWSVACSIVLVALAAFLPGMYEDASLAIWGCAAVAALVWLAREVALTFRTALAGFDLFIPHRAMTGC